MEVFVNGLLGASKFESAEKFMVDLLKHLDKNDKGVVSFENTASGFKG